MKRMLLAGMILWMASTVFAQSDPSTQIQQAPHTKGSSATSLRPSEMLDRIAGDEDLYYFRTFMWNSQARIESWQEGVELGKVAKPLVVAVSHGKMTPKLVTKYFDKPERITKQELPDIQSDGKPVQGDCYWYGPVAFCFLGQSALYMMDYKPVPRGEVRPSQVSTP